MKHLRFNGQICVFQALCEMKIDVALIVQSDLCLAADRRLQLYNACRGAHRGLIDTPTQYRFYLPAALSYSLKFFLEPLAFRFGWTMGLERHGACGVRRHMNGRHGH